MDMLCYMNIHPCVHIRALGHKHIWDVYDVYEETCKQVGHVAKWARVYTFLFVLFCLATNGWDSIFIHESSSIVVNNLFLWVIMGHYGSWWVIFHIFHLLPMETIIIFHMFSIVNCNRFPSCPWEKCTDLGPGDARCIQTLENLGASDWDYFPILYWIIWMIRYYTNDIIKVMIKDLLLDYMND